jgi:hypothetical protein
MAVKVAKRKYSGVRAGKETLSVDAIAKAVPEWPDGKA